MDIILLIMIFAAIYGFITMKLTMWLMKEIKYIIWKIRFQKKLKQMRDEAEA
jgi:hypothetical protein